MCPVHDRWHAPACYNMLIASALGRFQSPKGQRRAGSAPEEYCAQGHAPVRTSHSLTIPSSPALRKHGESFTQSTLFTAPACSHPDRTLSVCGRGAREMLERLLAVRRRKLKAGARLQIPDDHLPVEPGSHPERKRLRKHDALNAPRVGVERPHHLQETPTVEQNAGTRQSQVSPGQKDRRTQARAVPLAASAPSRSRGSSRGRRRPLLP